jgi:hypothetical protein
MRSDSHDAWINYEFRVDPSVSSVLGYTLSPRGGLSAQSNYCIIALPHLPTILQISISMTCHLRLDRIEDPMLRPLDELFTDHFMQGLFQHMKGVGEPVQRCEDYEESFGDASFNFKPQDLGNKGREGTSPCASPV